MDYWYQEMGGGNSIVCESLWVGPFPTYGAILYASIIS